MVFAIKAEVPDPRAKTFAFTAQKTMYGGKHIAKGDTVLSLRARTRAGKVLFHAELLPLLKRSPRNAASPGKRRASASP